MNNPLQSIDDSTDWVDPVFDTLLVESLGGPEPPDLTERILEALGTVDQPSSVDNRGSNGRFIEAPPVQTEQLREVSNHPSSSPFAVGVQGVDGIKSANQANVIRPVDAGGARRSESFRSPLSILIGLASLAASIAVAFWMFPVERGDLAKSEVAIAENGSEQSKTSASPLPTGTSGPEKNRTENNGSTENNRTTVAPKVVTAEQKKARTEPIKLEGPNFAGGPNAEFGESEPNSVAADAFSPIFPEVKQPLDGAEIVRLINTRLKQAWSSTGVQPAGDVDAETLVARVNNLLGVDSIATNVQFSGESLAGRVETMPFSDQIWIDAVQKGLGDSEAQEQLANRLAGSLLGRTGVRRINREQFVRFVSFLKPTISGEKRYDSAVTELLAARGSLEPKSNSFNPAAVWMGALAGPQSVALAEQAGHALLDVDLKCGRCHDHPLDGRVWQDQYWQFSAMFDTGLRWQVDQAGELQVTSAVAGEKQNVVFYEKADGRQRAATPQAPLNWILGAEAEKLISDQLSKPGDVQLRLLAGSMKNNPQLAKATVNLVWEAVYGRPLVGSVADPSAASETQPLAELQEELAEQLRAHSFDIGKLFAWVIAAKPMQLAIPQNWQSPKFESASAAELVAAAEQVRNFAGYPGSVPRRRFNDLLARVNVKDSGLINSLDAANNFPGGLLGQIQPRASSQNQAKRIVRPEGPSVDQLLSASLEAINHTTSEESHDDSTLLPAKWLNEVGGPNPFQRRVEHLYYLAGYWHPSPQQLEVARALREQSDSEAATLRKLWWVLANESL